MKSLQLSGFAIVRLLLCMLVCFVMSSGVPALAGAVQYSYDALGRLTNVINADGSSISYTYDPAGNRTQVVQVSLPTGSFSASPTTITQGSSTALTWSSSYATSASIDNGVGTVSPVSGGSVNVSPTVTTVYTLTLTGAGGTITRQVTVTVINSPTGSLSANPSSIQQGSSSTLTWSSTNATSASINNGVGSVTPVAGGSVNVTPSSTTTYTLTLIGAGGTITRTAAVTVNHPPVAVNDSVTTNENTAVTFDPRSNDSDSDGNALTITAVGSPSHGTVVNNSGTSVTYTPTTYYYGSDSFTYTISDGHGGTATATVAVTVNHVNQPPVAGNFGVSAQNQSQPPYFYIYSAYISPLAYCSDPDGDTLTITSVSQGTISGNMIIWTSGAPNFSSTTMTYTISDGHGHTATGTITIHYP
ncbi:MAG: Ig-like domain-containing protein [Rhizomicrobium sp.]